MLVGAILNVSDVFFERPTSLRRSFYVSLVSSGGAARIRSRRDVRETQRCVKVIFFQPSTPPQKKCVFVKGMKMLDSGFLLFVLTNKNLCLKPCGVLFPLIPARRHGAHESTPD